MKNKYFYKKFREVGTNVYIDRKYKYIDKSAIYFGNDVHILAGARIQNVSGDSYVKIGEKAGIGYNFTALAGANITIGCDVAIASDVFISAGSHGIDPEINTSYGNQKYSGSEIIICDGVWIGEKVCIISGSEHVRIGKKSIVGAGSIVTKSIPDYCIAVGNPAQVIKKYNFEKSLWEAVEKDD